jgi:hypothetical protein
VWQIEALPGGGSGGDKGCKNCGLFYFFHFDAARVECLLLLFERRTPL